MMEVVLRFFKAIYAALLWYRVQGFVPAGDYKAAMRALERCEALGFFTARIVVMKIYVGYMIGDYQGAKELIERAYPVIEQGSGFNCDEKGYLKCYVSMIDKEIHKKIESPLSPEFLGACQRVRQTGVREYVRSLFPIKYGF